jgi:hypothetical protein
LRKISKPDPGDIGSDEVALIHSRSTAAHRRHLLIPAPRCIFFE